MPVKKLTQPTIMRLKATDERQEIRDELTRGLHLIIQPLPTGTKSWALRFRRPDGKPAKLTLGSVDVSARKSADKPVIGGTLTLGEARVLAAQTDNERVERIAKETGRAAKTWSGSARPLWPATALMR